MATYTSYNAGSAAQLVKVGQYVGVNPSGPYPLLGTKQGQGRMWIHGDANAGQGTRNLGAIRGAILGCYQGSTVTGATLGAIPGVSTNIQVQQIQGAGGTSVYRGNGQPGGTALTLTGGPSISPASYVNFNGTNIQGGGGGGGSSSGTLGYQGAPGGTGLVLTTSGTVLWSGFFVVYGGGGGGGGGGGSGGVGGGGFPGGAPGPAGSPFAQGPFTPAPTNPAQQAAAAGGTTTDNPTASGAGGAGGGTAQAGTAGQQRIPFGGPSYAGGQFGAAGQAYQLAGSFAPG